MNERKKKEGIIGWLKEEIKAWIIEWINEWMELGMTG